MRYVVADELDNARREPWGVHDRYGTRGAGRPEAAHAWHKAQPWLVGCNFTPSNAINQLEMWQADSFDLATIDSELALAAGLGMNAVRVYLHDLLWWADADGVCVADRRLSRKVAAKHGIRTMLVLFDSCWDPHPELGVLQRQPTPGVHNSGWVQSPGMAVLGDDRHHARLEDVCARRRRPLCRPTSVSSPGTSGTEPDNGPEVALCDPVVLKAKADLVRAGADRCVRLGPATAGATQPLTSGIWLGDWSAPDLLSPIQRAQTELLGRHQLP